MPAVPVTSTRPFASDPLTRPALHPSRSWYHSIFGTAAVRLCAASPDRQRLRASPHHALIERRRKIQRPFLRNLKRKVERERSKAIASGLQLERAGLRRAKSPRTLWSAPKALIPIEPGQPSYLSHHPQIIAPSQSPSNAVLGRTRPLLLGRIHHGWPIRMSLQSCKENSSMRGAWCRAPMARNARNSWSIYIGVYGSDPPQ